jgi:integrase
VGSGPLHPVLEDTPEWRPGATPGSRVILDALKGLRVRSLLPDAPLFLRGDGPWPSWALQTEWRRVLTAAGVRYRVPEQLRHTFASVMLSRNAPLLYVQKQGGWRSAAVLLRVYSRWLPPDVAAVPLAQASAIPAQPEAVSARRSARK